MPRVGEALDEGVEAKTVFSGKGVAPWRAMRHCARGLQDGVSRKGKPLNTMIHYQFDSWWRTEYLGPSLFLLRIVAYSIRFAP